VSATAEAVHCLGEELFRDLQLVFEAQSVKDNFLGNPREDFRPQRLLGATENVPFQRRVVGFLPAHQFR